MLVMTGDDAHQFPVITMSGFHKAPFTKVTLLAVGCCSLLASLLECKHLFHLELFPHVIPAAQVWRLVTHHFVVWTSGDLLLTCMLLYHLRVFERRFGTAKFAACAVIVSALATVVQVGLLVLGRSLGLRATAPGPYGLIFALFVAFFRDIPVTYTMQMAGINVTEKTSTYMLALIWLSWDYPHSVPAALSGVLAGLLYFSDFGSLQRRRFPTSVQQFCSTYLLPHIASPSPYGQGWQMSRQANGVLATLDPQGRPVNFGGAAQGMGAAQPAGMRARTPAAPTAPVPPTEEQIRNLEAMGFTRGRILEALRRTNNNEARAVNILVDEA